VNLLKKSLIFALVLLCSCALKQKDEQRASLYLQIGNDCLEHHNLPDALTNFQQADKLSPDNPYIMNALGMLYFNREKYDVALNYVSRALKKDPKYTDARNNYARILIAMSRYNFAISELNKVLKDLTYAQQDKAFTNMGLAYMRKNEFPKAKPYFIKALTANRSFCPAYNLFGQTLLKMKDAESASHIFNEGLKVCDSNIEELHYFSAITDYQLGRKNEGRLHLQEIIKDNPASEYAEKAQKLLTALQQVQQ
jgi:Tfp pilus assembly protein PilF